MTRQEMKLKREERAAAKIAAKLQKKEYKREERSWNDMVERAKTKGAWIEE